MDHGIRESSLNKENNRSRTLAYCLLLIRFRFAMNRLLFRRCSMSSIEEEDESAASDDDAAIEVQRTPPPPASSASSQQELYRSSSVLEWDSELSESEGEDGDHHSNDDDEEQAASRVLQSFIQASTRTVSSLHCFLIVR